MKLSHCKVVAVALLSLCSYVKAEDTLFKSEPTVVIQKGPLEIYNPVTSPRVAYLLDPRKGESILGGEIPLFKLYIVEGIAGIGANVVDGSKNGFVGGNIALPNPLEQFVALKALRPGIAGAYNLDRKEFFFALKAAVPFALKPTE